jgi:hypothetical protein
MGAPVTSAPQSGAQAGKVVLTADHPTLVNDVSDVSFVKASWIDFPLNPCGTSGKRH